MPRKRSSLQNYAEYFAFRTVLGGLGFLPHSWAIWTGEAVGTVLSLVLPNFRKVAYRNLEIAMPELSAEEKAKIVRGCFRSIGRQIGFLSQFPKFKKEEVQDLIEIQGRYENFEPVHNRGTGILFFTGHFGSWEVFNLLAPAFGYPMNILVRRMDNPLIESRLDALRRVFGSVTIGKKKARRNLYRILDDGGFLGILADLNAQRHDGVFVDFFGVPAATTTSIAKIALKTRASLMPVFAIWDASKKKYVVMIEPEIPVPREGDRTENILDLTREITLRVEEFVRKHPEHWFWIHKRWKTRPEGEEGLY